MKIFIHTPWVKEGLNTDPLKLSEAMNRHKVSKFETLKYSEQPRGIQIWIIAVLALLAVVLLSALVQTLCFKSPLPDLLLTSAFIFLLYQQKLEWGSTLPMIAIIGIFMGSVFIDFVL